MGKAENSEDCIEVTQRTRSLKDYQQAIAFKSRSQIESDRTFQEIVEDAYDSDSIGLYPEDYENEEGDESLIRIFDQETILSLRLDQLGTIQSNFYFNLYMVSAKDFSIDQLTFMKDFFNHFQTPKEIQVFLENYQNSHFNRLIPCKNYADYLGENYADQLNEDGRRELRQKVADNQNGLVAVFNYDYKNLLPSSNPGRLFDALRVFQQIQPSNLLHVIETGTHSAAWQNMLTTELIFNAYLENDNFSQNEYQQDLLLAKEIETVLKNERRIFNTIGVNYLKEVAAAGAAINKSPQEFTQDYLQARVDLKLEIPESVLSIWSEK